MRRVIGLALAAVLAAGAAGCGAKLNEDKSYTLNNEVPSYDVTVPAISGEQKVKVVLKSTNGAEVDVDAYLGSKRATKGGESTVPPKASRLYSKEKVTEDTFEVTVPAKEDLIVHVSRRLKDATVTLKLTN